MTYTVIRQFYDLTDKNHSYAAGDVFPRPGLSVDARRLIELAGCSNKQGCPLIVDTQSVKDAETPAQAVDTNVEEIPADEAKTAEKPARGRRKVR